MVGGKLNAAMLLLVIGGDASLSEGGKEEQKGLHTHTHTAYVL